MNKKNSFISILLIIIISFVGCSSSLSPEQTVKTYFDSMKKLDFESANKLIDDPMDDFTFEDEQEEKMAKSFLSKIHYEIISSNIADKKATVKTKIIAPNLVKIVGKMIAELMPQLFALVFSNASDIDEQSEKLVKEYFENALNDPNLPMTTSEIDILLVKNSNNTWVINANDDLANAVTGNLARSIEEFSSTISAFSETPQEIQPDLKLYQEVNFKILRQEETPQKIIEILPRYQALERALACNVNGEIFIVVTRGEKPTGGYTVDIEKIEKLKEGDKFKLIVYAKFEDPKPGDTVTEAITYPYITALTDLIDLPFHVELKTRFIK